MEFIDDQLVTYRGEEYRVVYQQSKNYVRITDSRGSEENYSFCVHVSLLS